jgi:hypothetical protein
MANELKELLGLAEEARKAWDSCKASLVEAGFNMETPHPAFVISPAEFDRGLTTALELGSSIELEKQQSVEPVLAILPTYRPIVDGLTKIRDVLNSVRGFFQAAAEAKKTITIVDNNILTDSGSGQLNLGSQFQEIKSATNNFLGPLLSIADLLVGGNVADLASRSQAFQQLIDSSRDSETKIRNHEKEAARGLANIKKVEAAAQKQLATAEGANQKATGVNTTSDQALAEVNAKLAQIRESSTAAETLRVKVDAYNSQYEAFDSAMAARMKLFETFEAANKTAQQKNQQREQEIDKITQQANQMLQGATNAGLAKAFYDASERYDLEAKKAQRAFYVSIAILIFSAFPLTFYVFPIPHFDFMGPKDGTGITLGGVVARIVFLLPGVWLASFAALRHSSLFQLHREYAFKAAIAMSVDGFKKQAPQFEQEIAGAAFVGLAEKPDYAPLKETAKVPNPILGFLVKTLQSRFEKMSGGGQQK